MRDVVDVRCLTEMGCWTNDGVGSDSSNGSDISLIDDADDICCDGCGDAEGAR